MPLVLEFVGDASKFQRELSSATKGGATKVKVLEKESVTSAKKMTSAFGKFNKILGPLGLGLGLAGAIVGVKKLVVDTLNFANRVGDLSVRLGETTEFLSEMSFVADRAGVKFEQMAVGIQRANRRIAEARAGIGETGKVLDELGLQIENADGSARNFEEILPDLADAINGLSSEQDKLRIAFKLFDTEGVSFLQFLKLGNTEIEALRGKAKELGLSLDRDTVKKAAEAGDAITNLNAAMKGFGTELAISVVPAITKVANALTVIISAKEDLGKVPTEDLIVKDVGKLRTVKDIFGEIGIIINSLNSEVEVSGGRFSALASFMSAVAKAQMEMNKAREEPKEEEDPAKFAERIALIGKQNMEAIKARIAARKEESSIFKNQLAARGRALKAEEDLGQLIAESGLRAKEELDEVTERLRIIREEEKLLADTTLLWNENLRFTRDLTLGIAEGISNAVVNAENLGDALDRVLRQLASRALTGLIFGGLGSLLGLGNFTPLFREISGFQGGGRFTVPGPDTGADDRFVMIRTRGQEQITAEPQSHVTNNRFDSGVTIQRLEITTRTVDERFVRYELLPLLNRIERQGSIVNASRIRTS